VKIALSVKIPDIFGIGSIFLQETIYQIAVQFKVNVLLFRIVAGIPVQSFLSSAAFATG
jgi:hypothetical protein